MLLKSPYNKTLFIDIIENPQGTDFEINLSNLKLYFKRKLYSEVLLNRLEVKNSAMKLRNITRLVKDEWHKTSKILVKLWKNFTVHRKENKQKTYIWFAINKSIEKSGSLWLGVNGINRPYC